MGQNAARVITTDLSTPALNVTAPTLLHKGKGKLAKVIVTVAGTAPGSINDAPAVNGGTAANMMATIPNTVGVISFDFPYVNGLLITPGTGQTLSVSYT